MKKCAVILSAALLLAAAGCSAGANTASSVSVQESVSVAEVSRQTDTTPTESNTEPMIEEHLTELSLPYSDTRSVKVRVFVPAHQESETLPVVYMLDGQNLFEPEYTQFGSWNTREAVRAEREDTGRAAIIVGICTDNDQIVRTGDMLPVSIGTLHLFDDEQMTEMQKQQLDQFHPAGEAFDEFVTQTVMPAIEKQFPVKKGRAYTAFCGSSAAGVESFYTVMSHPDLFSAGGVFSPAFMYYAPEELEQWIRTKASQADNKPFLYLYVGGGESQEFFLKSYVDQVYEILQDCYPTDQLKSVYDEDQMHSEAAWSEYFVEFLHIFLENSAKAV